jgi:hypothetical protein
MDEKKEIDKVEPVFAKEDEAQAVQRDLGLIGLLAVTHLCAKLNAVGWEYSKYEGGPRRPARHLLQQKAGGKACAWGALKEVVVKCREELLAANMEILSGGWLPLVHETAAGFVIEWMPMSSPLPRLPFDLPVSPPHISVTPSEVPMPPDAPRNWSETCD